MRPQLDLSSVGIAKEKELQRHYKVNTIPVGCLFRDQEVLRPQWTARQAWDQDAKLVVLYGMDFIFDAGRWPYLLEVNQAPQMTYADQRVQDWVDGMGRDFFRFVVLPALDRTAPPDDTNWVPVD